VPPESKEKKVQNGEPTNDVADAPVEGTPASVNLKALQYHINIVLPDTRDQAVYDAIFKSLRDHLG